MIILAIESSCDETFGEDEESFKDYSNFEILEMNEEFFYTNPALNIIKYNLFKEESTLDFTPNYIRSGI